jgi:hypothetical protein
MQAEVQNTKSQAIGQGWRELCGRVAAQSELSEELASLTVLLRLPLSCCPAVHQVLAEGNWREAAYPKTYIKKAAMTQARKMHLAIPHKDDTLECGGAPLVFMGGNDLDRATTREGINAALDREYWESGKPRPAGLAGRRRVRVSEQFAPDEEVLAREREAEESRSSWPADCWIERPELPWKRDWKKLGEKAGLDSGQTKVLVYHSQGISRDRAMQIQRNEVSRKVIQAAWKRFERTGWKKVQDFLKKNRS